MSRNLEGRIGKLEQWRVPRPPYVISVSDPMTPADRAAIASAGRPVAVLPHKCGTIEEWAARYTPKVIVYTITARNIITRIEKLETSRRRPDEILLVWRKPNSDVAAAVATAKFAVGDRVICAEWFGERPLPTPKWNRRMQSEMDRTEYEYVNRSLERLVAARQRERVRFSVVPALSRSS